MPTEPKIKAKDLSYESTLPPFLQRLHDQNAGRGDQERHERAIARPKRAKANDEDDGPTVVDESGETVSKEDLEKLNGEGEDANVKGMAEEDGEPMGSGAIQDGEMRRVGKEVTDGTTTAKKRKVVKIVGEDDEVLASNEVDGKRPEVMRPAKKVKKKAKPIKLAFDNEDET